MLNLDKLIIDKTGSKGIKRTETVQTLWSDYGEIKRYYLEGGEQSTVIVKHIQLPETTNHPRGWNTDLSHQRKLRSYRVEKLWYESFANKTNSDCRVPQCYYTLEKENELLILMEDMDANGYAIRLGPEDININGIRNCLSWLAHFHAKFMGNEADGLWPVGSYWHLDTRPDEFKQMQNLNLKQAAKGIDQRLKSAKFQTIIHGDPKLANFCFSEDDKVAAVDFQYVGKGCGIKDVAYLISSCFGEKESEKYAEVLLQYYFDQLKLVIGKHIDYQQLKDEWNKLYPYAWADFYRFLDGWSPGHWKMHNYSKKLTQKVIKELEKL